MSSPTMPEVETTFEALESIYGDVSHAREDTYEDVTITFSPPAAQQRYMTVSGVLRDTAYKGKLKKIVEFGCSELNFITYMKNMEGIREILCVDVDRNVLEHCYHKAAPLSAEYLHCRPKPLSIEICEGSVTQNDKKLEQTDAVICIELIEHLYPDVLTDLVFNIFGYMEPKVVIMTTPNADFNVLFPRLIGYRHPDHKFEWSRKQFKEWGENIVLRYPNYSVTFQGICKGPEGSEDLGSLTQMAIFHRHEESITKMVGVEGLFTTIITYDYPYDTDNRSDEQKVLDEATYYIHFLSYQDGKPTEDELRLDVLLCFVKRYYTTIDALRTILLDAGWTIVEREYGSVIIIPTYSSYFDSSMERDMDDDLISDNEENEHFDPNLHMDLSIQNEEYLFQSDSNNVDWMEEPSIIIPENSSMIQENTYLYDGENSTMDDSYLPQNQAITNDDDIRFSGNNDTGEFPISIEQELPSNSITLSLDEIETDCTAQTIDSSTSSVLATSIIYTAIPNNTLELEDSTNSLINNSIQQSSLHNNLDRLKENIEQNIEVFNVQPHLSVSRSSTSPDPLFLNLSEMENSLHDFSANESYDQVHLANIFQSALDAKMVQSITKDKHIYEESFSDNCGGESKDENNKKDEDKDVDKHEDESYLQETEMDSLQYLSLNDFGTNGTYSVKQNDITSTNEKKIHEYSDISNTNPLNSCHSIHNQQPSFTSSPKRCVQIPSINISERNHLECKQLVSAMNNISLNAMAANEEFLEYDDPLNNSSEILSNDNGTITQMTQIPRTSSNNDLTDVLTCDMKSSIIDNAQQESSLANKAVKSINSVTFTETIKDSKEKLIENKYLLNRGTDISTDVENVETYSVLQNSSFSECAKEANVLEYHRTHSSKSNDVDNVQLISVLTSNIDSNIDIRNDIKDSTRKDKNTSNIDRLINIEAKLPSPLETPPNSYSPEIMDSGYPNSASVQDITPEYDLSSIAQDHIPDSESPSIAEAPRLGVLEPIEVENGDLANNNRDDEGNNMMAMNVHDMEDLQPLIDVLENDIENENDIYVVQNGFPIWLLRILDMANPLDMDAQAQQDLRVPDEVLDAVNYMDHHDEGFDSSSSENDSDIGYNEIENDNKNSE